MKELLEKYYEGLTTAEDEEVLREWMLHGDVPDDLAADRELFLRMEAEKTQCPDAPDDLLGRLADLIDSEAKKECDQHDSRKRVGIRHLSWWATAIAACAALIFGITYLMRPVSYIREVEDPKEARVYINMAMSQFGKAMDCGHRQMEKVGNALEKLNSIHSTK